MWNTTIQRGKGGGYGWAMTPVVGGDIATILATKVATIIATEVAITVAAGVATIVATKEITT